MGRSRLAKRRVVRPSKSHSGKVACSRTEGASLKVAPSGKVRFTSLLPPSAFSASPSRRTHGTVQRTWPARPRGLGCRWSSLIRELDKRHGDDGHQRQSKHQLQNIEAGQFHCSGSPAATKNPTMTAHRTMMNTGTISASRSVVVWRIGFMYPGGAPG